MHTPQGTRSISVWGARGGMGCTTTALLLAKTGLTAIVYDQIHNGGFDIPTKESKWSETPGPWELEISDRGPISEESRWDLADLNYIVLRGPSFLGLASIVELAEYWIPSAHTISVIVLEDEHSILTVEEVSAVLHNVKVTSMPLTPAIARLSDRGMICDIPTMADEPQLVEMLIK